MDGDDDPTLGSLLTSEVYHGFRKIAQERGMTLKEATEHAIRRWIETGGRPQPNDPAFTVLEELDRPTKLSIATDARTKDDLVELWRGESAAFRLADCPSSESEN